jgi:hypothetical protein
VSVEHAEELDNHLIRYTEHEGGILHTYTQYTEKKVIDFPVPGRDVFNQTLPGGE